MVVAADDVRHVHVVIVDDDRMHVGGRSIGAQQHHVVELLVGDAHRALHEVLDNGFAGCRRFQANDGLMPGGASLGSPHASGLVADRFARRLLRPCACAQALRVSRRRSRRGSWPPFPWRPRHAGPCARTDRRSRRPNRSRRARPSKIALMASGVERCAVGVLDAQPEGAADMARIEPVEQCGARIADVEEAGGRGREAGDDFHWKTGFRARFVLEEAGLAEVSRDGSDLHSVRSVRNRWRGRLQRRWRRYMAGPGRRSRTLQARWRVRSPPSASAGSCGCRWRSVSASASTSSLPSSRNSPSQGYR